jgi:hypothetical protein
VTARALLASLAGLALLASAGAAAAVPAPLKPQPPSGGGHGTQRAMGVLAGGAPQLLVTFADTPTTEQVAARLRGIGRLEALAPEAGVWAVHGADAAVGRAAAAGRPQVVSAEWALGQHSADIRDQPVRPRPPLPLPAPTSEPDDPLFVNGDQWSLRQPTWSWRLTAHAKRPRIAILDTGVDVSHEEWGGKGSPLVAPFSAVRDPKVADDWGFSGHGTHVAGIAAAPAGNGLGIVGVAPARRGSAEVVPVRIATPSGDSNDSTLIRGIRHAVRVGARVINISYGGDSYSRAVQETINWAYGRGALVIASVGNEGAADSVVDYPAGYRHVLGVGAQCDGQEEPVYCPKAHDVALFSTRNYTVDLIAPGVNVLSTVPPRVKDREVAPGYAVKSGTSMAAPYVAGVAALVLAANENGLSAYQVMRQLTNTATDLGRRGRDAMSGFGLVNAEAAVTNTAPADDVDEINDDIKFVAGRQSARERSPQRVVQASVDQYDDDDDVWPVRLSEGELLRVQISHRRADLRLYLWRPGTTTVAASDAAQVDRDLLAYAGRGGQRRTTLTLRAPRTGRYYLNVFARSGSTRYTLSMKVLPAR